MHDALSILRQQSNRSAQDGLPRPQLVSPPAMCFLRLSLRYPEAGALEPRGSEVARAATIPEGMEETPDVSTVWEVRGRVMRG